MTAKTRTARAMSAKSASVVKALVVGFLIELASRALNYFYHHDISQPISSMLYSGLSIYIVKLYLENKKKRLLPLILLSGFYSLILIVSLDNSVYNLTSGIVWKNELNYDVIYRAVEILVIIRTLWDASVFSRFGDNPFSSIISSAARRRTNNH